MTRVATALNEGPLLEYALSVSAARVEERCRQLRQGSQDSLKEARSVHAARGLRVSRPDERGMVTAVAEIPQELALLLTQALDKAIEQDVRDGPEFEDSSWSALQADALVVLAKHYLSGQRGGACYGRPVSGRGARRRGGAQPAMTQTAGAPTCRSSPCGV